MSDSSDPMVPSLLSVSHYACPNDLPLAGFMATVAAHGYGAIALTQRSFEEVSAREVRALTRERGLEISSVNSAGYFLHSDPERARAQEIENARLLQLTADTEARGLNVIVGGSAEHAEGLASARECALEALALLARNALAYGVHLFVEPVHPAGLAEKGCLNTIGQVRKAISGIPNASLTIDLFHSWWDPDLDHTLAADEAPVGLLQICDVSTDTQGMAVKRSIPGRGIVEIRRSVLASARHHPLVPIELELFARGIAEYDLDGTLHEVRRLIGAWGIAAAALDEKANRPGSRRPRK